MGEKEFKRRRKVSIFICEKCGKLDNTALNNNYWVVIMAKVQKARGEKPGIHYFKPKYSFFDDHVCCSDCCNGIEFYDGSGKIEKSERDIQEKRHWSEYGKDTLLEWEARGDGSMVNASEYFKENNILKKIIFRGCLFSDVVLL